MSRELTIVKWVSEQRSPQELSEHLNNRPKRTEATLRRRIREDEESPQYASPDSEQANEAATLYGQMMDLAALNYKPLSAEDKQKLMSIAARLRAETDDLESFLR